MDKREDAGEFYPGGKVISTRPVATGGDVKHSDFAGLDVKTNTIPDLRDAVRELGRRLGATVVTALAACVATAATVQTVPVNDLDFDANPPVVTNVTFEGLADATNVYTKAETDAAISQIPPPDFSTNNTALVETIKATAPAPGNYAVVSNTAVHAAITNALQDTAIAGKADREIVIGQGKGLPGDCFPIAYVYNGDSYSIVNSGGIVVDQLGPLYYRLADSVTGVAVCYFSISDGTYFSNGEASGITFGGTAPTRLAWPVLGDVAKKSSVVYDVDIKTNYYTRAETEAKIVELAPAPGDYATVSNRAMSALQSYTETDPTISSWAKAQTKPTYTASEVGATTPEDVTAAIREQSLGGIWDAELEVWWTPRMRNGNLTYEATTNVNLNAVN